MISGFRHGATRAEEADWIELTVLSKRGPVYESEFLGLFRDLNEDEKGVFRDTLSMDEVEAEILEPEQEAATQRAVEELAFRQAVLGDCYPFEFIERRTRWELRPRVASHSDKKLAHSIYITALLISGCRTGLLQPGQNDTLRTQIDRVMQILAYLIAPEIVSGEAYWFGHPRPEHNGMLDAVKSLATRMGFGQAYDERPPGVAKRAKDGTVDLIAWRRFADLRYGSLVLYGQVASGKNWPSKPIASHLESRFFAWFEHAPANRKYLEAIFIPFMQHHETEEDTKYSFHENSLAESRNRSKDYGMIVDRLRLTELGQSMHQRAATLPENGLDYCREVIRYRTAGEELSRRIRVPGTS